MTEVQMRIVKALRGGLPVSAQPFDEIAEKAGVSREELLAQLRTWKKDGTIRRFGAFLRHNLAGYTVNAMAVWDVPEAQVEHFGQRAAASQAVSHCYERPRFDGFEYNLYTMIHGKSTEDCEAAAKEIRDRTGITRCALLYTTAEFKKSSPVYFADAPKPEE